MEMSKPQLDAFRRELGRRCNGHQGAVAKRAGISRVFLNRILRGRAIPSLEVAIQIAQALGTSIDALTGENSKNLGLTESKR